MTVQDRGEEESMKLHIKQSLLRNHPPRDVKRMHTDAQQKLIILSRFGSCYPIFHKGCIRLKIVANYANWILTDSHFLEQKGQEFCQVGAHRYLVGGHRS